LFWIGRLTGIDRSPEGAVQTPLAGQCYGNAAAESRNATFKKELAHLHLRDDAGHVRQAAFRYIEAYYNRSRIRKELGYLSPAEYEAGFDGRMAKAA
jgi:putative transposase